jgi:hypothetical protein
VSAVITAALSDGVGIIALANADAKQPALTNITLAIGAKLLGLLGSSSSPLNQTIVSRTQHQRRADVAARADSTTGLSSLDLAGTYYNAGYGTAVLCSVRSSSASCQNVLGDFRSVDESLLSPNSPDLFVSWDAVWYTHIRFTHTNSTRFLLSTGTIYPEGYGKNSTPFSTLVPAAMVEFVVEDGRVVGFGIGGTSDVTRAGSVEETSDVWFVKQS